jgi:hypothetical protein
MTIQPGTVSHGTMRPEDLIPAFLDALPAGPDKTRMEHEWGQMRDPRNGLIHDERGRWTRATPEKLWEMQGWLLEELFDALNELAPRGYYFGSSEGDGSDYGFWMWQELECDECGSVIDSDAMERYEVIGKPQERYLCSDCGEDA